ncbi:MAG: PQQ-binding-like beta-propeller repeat protein, partial [Planctomycetota bacterium]|nr:PQQ-binding-like beta-propeller repeat protein [Planctomycetota bacterium]
KQAWRVRLPAPIATSTHAPGTGILVGLNDARLLCLSEEGVQLWEARLPARPLKVAAGSIAGKGTLIAAALEDRSVQAIDAKGRTLWRFGPLPEAEGRNSYGRSSPNVMRSIAVNDLNGDGRLEVAVGAGYIMALSQTGKLLWSEKHLKLTDGLRNMTVTDLNGDGRIEILAADAWTYPFWYALSHNGQPYWMAAKKMGKPGEMDMKRLQLQGAPLAIASGKYLGTKETQSACVDAKGVLHLADARGNLLGRFNVGEPSPAMASLDLDGDGSDELLAGSESHHLFALTGKCKLKWRVNCGGPVSAIAGLDATPQSQGWVAIAVRQGPLLVADSKGNIKARWLDRARRTTMLIALHPHTDPTAGRIVTGASDGTLVAFEGTGRHGSF